jgi:predicted transposase/invertase (TIGR01784 family)
MSENANRQYKNSVFTTLFGEKDNALELYNAIQNTNYGADTPVEMTTLENVLYMELINDVSFVIDGKIVVLIEHQSTINENMPLRMLLYIAKVYQKITKGEDLYRERRISIPRPEFIVLYNGKDEYPDKQTLKLSEMFALYGENCPIELELIVQVYNINKGRNPEFAKRSENLNGYEEFIATIREYENNGMLREEAMKKAVKDCISRNVLKEFLEKNGSEVMNMLLTEWNTADALRVREQEGITQGIRQGQQQTAIRMLNKGMSANEVAELTGLFIDDVLRLQY